MWEIIFIGICILVGSNVVLRLIYGETITGKYWRKKGYEKGYRDGTTNVKMYFSLKQTLPSTHWLKTHSGTWINTREKLDRTLED